MKSASRRLMILVAAALACLLFPTGRLHAQFYGHARGLPGHGRVVVNPVYPHYGAYSYADPYGGYLRGAADVISAQGGYLKDVQSAYLQREQVKAAQIQNKKLAFDEWRYEKSLTPTLEEQREQERIQGVLRSKNNPPATEIWSGKALNDLLQDLQQRGPNVPSGPPLYLNQDMLKHINVTTGASGAAAGAGVLRNDGKLQWPFALQDDVYATNRKKVDELAAAAVQQASKGQPEFKTVKGLIDSVAAFQDQLKRNVANTEPNQYIRARRYLNELDQSVKTLQDPNASQYFSRQWAAQGNTVAELVAYMTAQGLRFAPANPGDEAAYNSLHRSLASYQTTIAQASGK